MGKRKVEVFTAGCPVCDDAVNLVKSLVCESCELVIWDLNKGCATNECRDRAKEYGITRVPSVVVDGKIVDCCRQGKIDEAALKSAGIGQSQ